jgi:hypothetical protein
VRKLMWKIMRLSVELSMDATLVDLSITISSFILVTKECSVMKYVCNEASL